MVANNLVKYFFTFVFLVLLQITIFFHTSILGLAYCFIYVSLLIFLPLSINRSLLMTIAFLLGLTVDLFYNTPGINAFACVTIAFFKVSVFKFFLGNSDLDENVSIALNNTGISLFVQYTFFMLFFHHSLIFLIHNFDSRNIFYNLFTSFLSSLLTLFVIVLGEYLFFKERR